jgi:ribosome-binding protein aMBF1 (putative translation factor)
MMGNKSMLAHRAAMVLAGNIIPTGSLVCHKCDNRSCVNPDHLFIGSHRDNMRDMRSKGRGPTGDKNGSRKKPDRLPRGENHVKSKLTDDAVVTMRRLRQAGMSQREIAERFGVSRPLVSLVVHRKLWAHVQ